SLPPHCEPTNAFLYHLSSTFHTCVPTNLAFLSTALGTCSIVAWLFAQLPQIYKNHQLKSTSGLSFFFLAEWLLGDVSNLLGCVLTGQALWQVIIAAYYVTVDCALVGQWIWYERLGGATEGPKNVAPGSSNSSAGRYIPHHSNPMDAFRIPNFARSPRPNGNSVTTLNTPPSGTPPHRQIRRVAGSPMPSPKTVLYISMLLCILSTTSTATPVSPFAPAPLPHTPRHSLTASSTTPHTPSTSETLGTLSSWLSTFLYLGSRLPQLYKNHVRKSTAGLSPTLFAAAFFGNLFYSSSLLSNPCFWSSYPAGNYGRGWISDPAGSNRRDWALRAAPFFLGAAGVLLMDACVGVQFWMYGSKDGTMGGNVEEEVVIIKDHGIRKRIHRRWRRASGWMRGWAPS
ncbi:hypothetical protein M011DRAFT_378680, partial [Sporormia fimetaria CBS 119925]